MTDQTPGGGDARSEPVCAGCRQPLRGPLRQDFIEGPNLGPARLPVRLRILSCTRCGLVLLARSEPVGYRPDN